MATFEMLGHCYPIVQALVDRLDMKDLPAFRLASLYLANKSLHDVTTTRFAEEFFEQVTVFLSRKSLTMLVDICAHPVFGRYIRHIGFASENIVMSNSAKVPSQACLHGGGSNQECEDIANKPTTFGDLSNEQAELRASGEVLRLFTTALERLSVPIVLELRDNAFADGVLGTRSSAVRDNPRPKDVARVTARTFTFDIMVRAVTLSGCVIRGFVIRLESDAVAGAHVDDSIISYETRMATAMDQLEPDHTRYIVFETGINIARQLEPDQTDGIRDDLFGTDNDKKYIDPAALESFSCAIEHIFLYIGCDIDRLSLDSSESMSTILSYAPCLSRLEIIQDDNNIWETEASYNLQNLLRKFSAPELLHLTLVGHELGLPDLPKIFTHHPKLRSLQLRDCFSTTSGTWCEIFSSYDGLISPLLTRLTLSNLRMVAEVGGTLTCRILLPVVRKYDSNTLSSDLPGLVAELAAKDY